MLETECPACHHKFVDAHFEIIGTTQHPEGEALHISSTVGDTTLIQVVLLPDHENDEDGNPQPRTWTDEEKLEKAQAAFDDFRANIDPVRLGMNPPPFAGQIFRPPPPAAA